MSLTSYDPSLLQKASLDPPKLVPFSAIESALSTLLSTLDGVNAMFASQQKAFEQSTLISRRNGVSSTLPIQTAGQPPQPSLRAGVGAQVCIKTGYTKNGEKMVSKVAAGGGDDTGNTGVVFVFDQHTLRLNTILCDEGILTEVRTAAACAYASKFLLGRRTEEITKVGIVGGGVQACWQLRLLRAGVLPDLCRTAVIKTRSKKSAEDFMQRMKSSSYAPDREWQFEHFESVNDGGEAFHKCQLIHTLTPSREPVLSNHDVCIPSKMHEFLHITAVGADSPGKYELDPDLIREANALVCDSIPQSKERGEFQSDNFSGKLKELGSLTKCPHESTKPYFSIFDSSGLALQDVEMANLVSKSL